MIARDIAKLGGWRKRGDLWLPGARDFRFSPGCCCEQVICVECTGGYGPTEFLIEISGFAGGDDDCTVLNGNYVATNCAACYWSAGNPDAYTVCYTWPTYYNAFGWGIGTFGSGFWWVGLFFAYLWLGDQCGADDLIFKGPASPADCLSWNEEEFTLINDPFGCGCDTSSATCKVTAL